MSGEVQHLQQLVSIIIPVYNMEKSLATCVESVCAQDYNDLEIILIDDGSLDKSWNVCLELSRKHRNIRCLHTENQGSGPARNVGIKNSKGDYLYFPDADDYISPDTVSLLVSATENGKYDLIVFGYKNVTRSGSVIYEKKYDSFTVSGNTVRNDYSEYFGMDMKHSIQGAPWNKFFSGKIIRDNGLEFPPLRRHQDECFISRYMCCAENVKFIPDVLYTYYPNTVGCEWKKYPVNYEDCAIGLYSIWKETICSWNISDKKTHLKVDAEYLTKVIKSLELSYSPKVGKNIFTRPSFVKNICKKTSVEKLKFECAGSVYQKFVLALIKLHFYGLLSLFVFSGVLKTKVRQG